MSRVQPPPLSPASITKNQFPWLLVIASAILFALLSIRQRKNRSENVPPLMPYRIPFLGHALSFLKDNYGFIDSVKNKFPKEKIVSLNLGGQIMHVIFDVDLALPIFRSQANFSFDPVTVQIARGLGFSKSDVALLKQEVYGSGNDKEGNGRKKEGMMRRTHHLTSSSLRGEGLDAMTEIFINQLRNRISAQFPKAHETSFDWQEVELVAFITRILTLSSTAALYGTKFLENEGEDHVLEWMWAFDSHVVELLTLLPDFMIREAARRRDQGIGMMLRWEKFAKASGHWDKKSDGGLWNEVTGMRYTKERTKLEEEEGLSERGRAASHVAHVFGLNANAIPTATWAVINALSPAYSDYLPNLLSEIRLCTNTDGRLDISKLTKQPNSEALLRETYRLSIHSPGLRTVMNDTQVGSYSLKKGSLVMIHTRSLQLSPEIWGSDASNFSPQRFLPSDSENILSKEAKEKEKKKQQSMRPFGGGYNMCPGRYFAANEILGGFAVLMQMLEVEVIEGQGDIGVELKKGKMGGLWPDREVRVRMRRRKAE